MESRRRWIIAGVVVPLVGVAATVVAYLFPREAERKADLQVSAFEVRRVEEIKADLIDPDEVRTPDRMRSAFIDVTIKNAGTSTAVVTGAEFRVKVLEEVELCKPVGGPTSISGYYTVALPNPLPKIPFSIRHSIRHEVQPNGVDRLAFTVGPKVLSVDAPSLLLYQVDVFLNHDDPSTGPVLAGTALLLSPIYYGEHYGEGKYREFFKFVSTADPLNRTFDYNNCIRKNREKVSRLPFTLA